MSKKIVKNNSRWMIISEAVDCLEISRQAIHKRLKNGTMKSKINKNGITFVQFDLSEMPDEEEKPIELDSGRTRREKPTVNGSQVINLFDESGRKVIPSSKIIEKMYEATDLLILIREDHRKELESAKYLDTWGNRTNNRPYQNDIADMYQEYLNIFPSIELCVDLANEMAKAFRLSSSDLNYINGMLFMLKRDFDLLYPIKPEDTDKYKDNCHIPINQAQYRQEKQDRINQALKLVRECIASMSPDALNFRSGSDNRTVIQR